MNPSVDGHGKSPFACSNYTEFEKAPNWTVAKQLCSLVFDPPFLG